MPRLSIVAAAAGLLAGAISAPTSVQAAVIHDTLAEFDTIVNGQGTLADGGPITDTNRNSVANIFDGNASTFFSLGKGGTISFTIKPTTNQITSGTVIEITNPSAHQEATEVFLGTKANPFASSLGYLFNEPAKVALFGGPSAPAVDDTSAIADLAATNIPGSGGLFTITVLSGIFNTIAFADRSIAPNNQFGTKFLTGSTDGFDIDALSVTSVVPLPAAAWLFGSAFLGLCWLGRRSATRGVGMLPTG
jgi:hypothetical protein